MYSHRIITLFAFLLCTIRAHGQGPDTAWTRTYGGPADDRAYSVQQTCDNGYIIGGCTRSYGAGDLDLYLVKTDEHGETLWTRTYGGAATDIGYSVKQTADSGYIFVGSTTSYGAGGMDVYLVRTNTSGDTLWTRAFGGGGDDIGFAVIQTHDNNFVITGITYSYGLEGDVDLMKVDTAGTLLWQERYGGINRDGAFSLAETGDDELLVAGVTASFGAGGDDMWLLRLSADGDTLWTKCHGNERDQSALCVATTSNRGCVVAGYGYWELLGDEMVVLCLNEHGDTLWRHCNGSLNDDCAYAATELTSGTGCIIAGNFSYEAFVIRTDTLGAALWTQMYGGAGVDCVHDIKETSDRGYILAGMTDSFGAGQEDMYVVKILPDTLCMNEQREMENCQEIMTVLPHPVSDRCRLLYRVWQDSEIRISLFNVTGEFVKNIIDSHHVKGMYALTIDTATISSGIYFLYYRQKGTSSSRKIIIVQ